MFYDENGKHVRTKKELLKQENFVDEVKHFYTDLINLLVKDDKEKLHVFDSSGLYLATKKIGKSNPKAEQIQTHNEMRMRRNREVDRAIVSGVPETEIQQIKKEYITDRIRESVDVFGNQPERLESIIMTAVMALALLISKVLDKARELSAKFFENETVQPIAEPYEGRTAEIIPQTDKTSKQEQSFLKEPTTNSPAQKRELHPKTQIPPKSVMSAEADAYPNLLKIYKELNRQNGIIFDEERERNELELERDNLYGFQTVQAFYKAFAAAKTANTDYRDKANNREKIYGIKAQNDTMQEKIQNLQRKISQQKEQMP